MFIEVSSGDAFLLLLGFRLLESSVGRVNQIRPMPKHGWHYDMTGEHEEDERLKRSKVEEQNNTEKTLQQGRRELADNASENSDDNNHTADEVEKQHQWTEYETGNCGR